MKKYLRFLVICAVALFTAGIPGYAQLGWIEDVSNPIFGEGTTPIGPKAYYSNVVYDASSFSGNGGAYTYKMWYGTSSSQTGLAYSNDGITWTDQGVVMTNGYHAQVIYDANGFGGSVYYKMWYWSGTLYTVGDIRYTESTDGITWTNDQSSQNGVVVPFLGVPTGWNRGSYGPSTILYNPTATNTGIYPFDYTYAMYFLGNPAGNGVTGLAYSTDGITWNGYDSNSDGNADPVLVGTGASWDAYAEGWTILKNASNDFEMWYSGGNGASNNGIGYATSIDGLIWTKDVNNPIFHISDGITWRDDRTYTPSVIKDGPNYKMWFTGKDLTNGDYSIGYATLSPPTDVWVDDDYTSSSSGGHIWGYDAFDNIQDGIDAVDSDGTVNVAAGTYVAPAQIVINKNLTLSGAGNSLTTIEPGFNTTVGYYLVSDALVYVDYLVTATIENLAIDGTGYTVRHAIQSRGTDLTVRNCDIRDIYAAIYAGRGIVFLTGTGLVENCTMSNIQRIGVHIRGSVEPSPPSVEVTGLTYTGKGLGDFLDYGVEVGGGGHGLITNSTFTDCLGEASDESTSAGILVTDFYGTFTTAEIDGCILTGNTTGLYVGYIETDVSVVSIHNSTITGNSSYGVYSTGPQVNATHNWWGDASGPSGEGPGTGDAVSTYVDYYPYYADAAMTILYSPEVYVDDDFDNLTPGWGVDHFDNIQDGIAHTAPGGTVNVYDGTYNETGQIVISKAINIVGDYSGKGLTTISPMANTGTSGDARGWFLVNDGIEFNLSNVTLDGDGYLVYQGIRDKGFGTFDNVTFYNIKYNESGPDYGGTAIAVFGATELNVHVINSHFSEIGRIGVLYFGTGLTGSNFTGNTYIGKGAGDWLDYALDISNGAVIAVDGCTISGCLGVTIPGGWTSGAIMVTTYFGPGTEALITNCTLTGNTTGIIVGFDEFDGSTVEAHYNNISGNTSYGVSNSGSMIVDALSNWWGDATGPYHPTLNVGGSGNEVGDNILFDPWFIDPEMTQTNEINIGLFETTCGDFEVRVMPGSDINNYLSNIQFTIKWPESTVSLIDPASTFGIAQQGTTTVDGGYNYAVFVGAAYLLVDWTAGEEYTVLTFIHDESSSGTASFEIADDAWATANNAQYYIEIFGYDETGLIYASADNVFLGSCDINLMAYLQGPYNTTSHQMDNDLNGNLLADQSGQPFDRDPWNYGGTETLPDPLDAGVVDWILVELRDGTDETIVLETKAGQIYQDGSIAVRFDAVVTGEDYNLALWHRNHMPVLTVGAVTLPNATAFDFTTLANCYGNGAIELETDVYGMIAGDINSDGYLKYSGPSNDRGLVLVRINLETSSTNINGIAYGYFDEDVMMDYDVKYIGTDNDRAIMIPNLADLTGTPYLNAVYQSVVPGATAKSGVINDGPINIFLNETVNELQVMINTDESISNGMLDNVQFTLSWDTESSSTIIPVLENIESSFGLMAQGEAVEKEGKMYQVFVSVLPVELPSMFTSGEEVVLMSITKDEPVALSNILSIGDDYFIDDINGAYYISLFGDNYTGVIHTSTLDITELYEASLSIYPNPVTSGLVNVEMNLVNSQQVMITILDIQGRVITTEDYQPSAGLSKTEINLDNLDKGVYFIKVNGDNMSIIQKLVIQ